MPKSRPKPPDPTSQDVAFYLSDMCRQYAAMARGAGLREVERELMRAHDLCEQVLERRAS